MLKQPLELADPARVGFLSLLFFKSFPRTRRTLACPPRRSRGVEEAETSSTIVGGRIPHASCRCRPGKLRWTEETAMRQQIVVPSDRRPVTWAVDRARALGRRLRRGVIRAVAILTMLVIYAVTSLGSIATSALGVVGISSAALVGTAAPADAGRRGRRRSHRGRWHRGHGFYWGDPWRGRRGFYWGDPWRRRRRRGHGFGLYFRF